MSIAACTVAVAHTCSTWFSSVGVQSSDTLMWHGTTQPFVLLLVSSRCMPAMLLKTPGFQQSMRAMSDMCLLRSVYLQLTMHVACATTQECATAGDRLFNATNQARLAANLTDNNITVLPGTIQVSNTDVASQGLHAHHAAFMTQSTFCMMHL